MTQARQAALGHIRVLDLSRVLAGPWATQTLADLGAEVIKIERPRIGDDTRRWGPPYLRDLDGNETSESAYYLCANRGKKSVTVDVTQTEGQDIVRGLAQHSDIVVENFKVGALAKFRLGYEDLSTLNPALIYCSITGFGQSGPYAEHGGYDFIIQGMGGLMSITGERDDRPGGGPQKMGVAIADLMTGMYATVAILGALEHRHQSGNGQYIDLALLDVQVAMLANQNMNYLVSGRPPSRSGNAHPNIVPYQVFACRDGQVVLAVGNDGQFKRLCEIAGQPELAADPRFATNPARVRHREVLIPILDEVFRHRASRDWSDRLMRAGVPCGPINDLKQVFEDAQVRHRRMHIELDHPLCAHASSVANPLRLSETPVCYRAAAPTLGQHTEEVLGQLLGLDPQRLARLAEAGIV